MGRDTLIQNAIDRRNLPALFAALPLLRELDPAYLERITTEIEWFSLPGGTTLYSAGQPTDGVYAVVNGSVGCYVPSAAGGSRCVATIPAGETVGEAELIAATPRTTTVIALRDTEVALLPAKTFERLVRDDPLLMRSLAAMVVRRLEAVQQSAPIAARRASARLIAVVPNSSDVDVAGFAAQLARALGVHGRTEQVLKAQGNEQTSHWFHRVEQSNAFVIYVAEAPASNWTKLCLRQADGLLMVAHHDAAPRPWAALDGSHASATPLPPPELVRLHASSAPETPTRRWLDQYPYRRHHQIRAPADVARLARLLTGNATGIVLSGGGARGFAHIGVMRALLEAKIPIDAVGGSSIGSIIGAGWAAGWEYAEMVRRVRHAFVDSDPLGDYTLPMISLVAGRRVGALLREQFGDAYIEDLGLPFFCVSANLTSGQAAVHRQGPLWKWLRASIAIPGVLPPVFSGRQAYVDGATINNLPVDVMRDTLAGTVIGVDVGSDRGFETDLECTEVPPWWRIPGWRRSQRQKITLMQILLRAGLINSAAASAGQRQLSDLVLSPPLERIDLLDWKAFDRIVDIGYRHAVDRLERHYAARPTPAS